MDRPQCGLHDVEVIGVGGTHQHPAPEPTMRRPRNYRGTGIVCTIGPKSNSLEILGELRSAGLDIVRLNFSYGDHEFHQSVISNVRELQRIQKGRPVAIALDTKGPEIRTGVVRGGEEETVSIAPGKELIITAREEYAECCDDEFIFVDYKNIANVVQRGHTIFINDGILKFEVSAILDTQSVRARTQDGGVLRSKSGVNLPNTDVDLPFLDDKDRSDLRFGIAHDVDMVFASFVRSAEDIDDIREELGEQGKHIEIIAKIEDRRGLLACKEIIAAADGVMVARGDLGIELPHSGVFVAQKKIISLCNIAGKPVICATQMFESMILDPQPTRAEISDVGNAIMDGADCVSLSRETSIGNYPVQAVKKMHETCLGVEGILRYAVHFEEMCSLVRHPASVEESCAMSAVRTSLDLAAGVIIVLSASGNTARLVSKYRPSCPILMVSENVSAARYSHLSRGVYPMIYDERGAGQGLQWQAEVDMRIAWAIARAQELGMLREGDPVVAVQGWKPEAGYTSIVRILTRDASAGK